MLYILFQLFSFTLSLYNLLMLLNVAVVLSTFITVYIPMHKLTIIYLYLFILLLKGIRTISQFQCYEHCDTHNHDLLQAIHLEAKVLGYAYFNLIQCLSSFILSPLEQEIFFLAYNDTNYCSIRCLGQDSIKTRGMPVK